MRSLLDKFHIYHSLLLCQYCISFTQSNAGHWCETPLQNKYATTLQRRNKRIFEERLVRRPVLLLVSPAGIGYSMGITEDPSIGSLGDPRQEYRYVRGHL
jgi:hypothetical protein